MVTFKKRFVYLLLQREDERKKERESKCVVTSCSPPLGTWPTTQAHALTGDQTSDPLVHRPVLNPLGHTSQGKKEKVVTFTMYLAQ